jgi:ABC-type sugar transport system ATPase subunit
MPSESFVLEVREMVKAFPGVRALDGARLQLRAGECHALVGENGAGKSTLMNILAGVHQPDGGEILLDGRPVRFPDPYAAARLGIGTVFQELSLVPGLSIAENIFAHRQPIKWPNRIDWKKLRSETARLLALFALPLDPWTLVHELSAAQKQQVEILKALSHSPRVVLLDEPTSSLAEAEVRRLFALMRDLRRTGTAFVYISHHLPEIFAVADHVTVMRDGRYVETLAIGEATEEIIVRKMVGRDLPNLYGQRIAPIGEPYFSVSGATRGRAFQEINLTLRRGEIVGLAGLIGAGRTEFARGLCGLEPLERGIMTLENTPLHIGNPAQAVRHGLAYLTEDRKEQGLFLRMAIRDNTVAPSLRRYANALGWVRDGAMDKFAEESRRRFNVVARSIKQVVGSLSGGNQQKVLLAMWMGIGPKVLIVDEPTRGVDIGAKSEIYAALRALAATGVGIILISSDLLEIRGVCDRILVLRQGRVAAEFTGAGATEEAIIAAATGISLENDAHSRMENSK